MKKYEYKNDVWEVNVPRYEDISEGFCQHLNELGEDGWELINHTKTYTPYNHTYTFISIFKRAYHDE